MDKDTKAQIEELKKKFTDMGTTVTGNIPKVMVKLCLIIERDIKQSMQRTNVEFGYTSKRTGKYIVVSSSKGRSKPGNPPAPDTGRLMGSITHRVEMEGNSIIGYVGTSVKYGVYLEYGTSKIAARPWLGPAIERNRKIIRETIGEALTSTHAPQGPGLQC